MLFLILAVVNQGLWLSWAILVPDIGTMIFATVTGIITVFNLIWWSLRMLGLRPLLAAGTPGQGGRHTGSTATARRHRSLIEAVLTAHQALGVEERLEVWTDLRLSQYGPGYAGIDRDPISNPDH